MQKLEATQDIIHQAIIGAFKLLENDYKNNVLCEEGSMQAALYYHLRCILSPYIHNGDLRVWAEYPVGKGDKIDSSYIDLAIIRIDESKINSEENKLHLKYCVKEIYAFIELKFNGQPKDKINIDDEEKLDKYMSVIFPKNNINDWKKNGIRFSKYILGISEHKGAINFVLSYKLRGESKFHNQFELWNDE